jgi:protein-S-isoprenylcysteine O-methyltransferase Ste14
VVKVWADSLLKKHRTTVKPHESPTALVTSESFRASRHPMRLGMSVIFFGAAMLLGWIVTFVSPVVFIIPMEGIFIRLQQRNLEEILGERYVEYRKRVRRWM